MSPRAAVTTGGGYRGGCTHRDARSAPDPKGTGPQRHRGKGGKGGRQDGKLPPLSSLLVFGGSPPPLLPFRPPRVWHPPHSAPLPIGRKGPSHPAAVGILEAFPRRTEQEAKRGGGVGWGGGPIRVTPPAQCAAQGGTLPAQREGGGRDPFCAPPPARAPLIPPRSPPIRAPPPVTLWGGRGGVWGCEGGGVVGWGSRCEHCLSQGGFPERLQVVLELEGTRLEVELEQNW